LWAYSFDVYVADDGVGEGEDEDKLDSCIGLVAVAAVDKTRQPSSAVELPVPGQAYTA